MRHIFQACSMIFILGNLASQSQSSDLPSVSDCGMRMDTKYRVSSKSDNEEEVRRGNHTRVQSEDITRSRSSVRWNWPNPHGPDVRYADLCASAPCPAEPWPAPDPWLPWAGWRDAISTTIINFNNEKMQITWAARELFPGENVSFSYTFDEGKHKVWKPCPTYLLDQDYNSGCLFKTEGPTLAISIRNGNGSEQLFSKRLKSDFYIKPNRPENVTFFWKENTVTVTCNKPERAVKCLRLELQYKSKFDKEWQSRTSKCCSIGEQGFDPRKCYSFRVRLRRLVPHCNVVNYSSDWEAETVWMNGTLVDSCDGSIKPRSDAVTVLSCLLAVLLMVLILLILLCRWQRLQKSVMPAVPDPKYIFADLFSDHNGNFQEWIDKTDRAVVQTKLQYEEPECIIEAESQQEDEKNSDKQGLQAKVFTFPGAAENNGLTSAQIACLMPASDTVASLAGFQILMSDDVYVML